MIKPPYKFSVYKNQNEKLGVGHPQRTIFSL